MKPVSISGAVLTLGATSYVYNGSVRTPGVISVKLNGVTLREGVDYRVTVPAGRTNAGSYLYLVTGIGSYTGMISGGFRIDRAASAIRLADQTKVYTGKTLGYTGTVARSGSAGAVTYTYYSDARCTKAVRAADVKAAKTYYVRATVSADANHTAAVSAPVKFRVIYKGWQKINKKWYYYNASGGKVTGWKKLGKKWYFFKKDGSMAANEYCKGYWLNKDGAWTYKPKASWKKNKKGWYYIDTKHWYAKNTTITIDGKKYKFDKKGYLK